jgi:hypothetical protein
VIQSSTRFKPFRERVLGLGDEQNVVAIVTDAADAAARKPAVVMLNAGVLHRVGPRRMHVALGRELAARGFPACRVDLSGIGDSRQISGHTSFRDSAVADTRLVMDALARESAATRFVIFGLCSGADNALAVAKTDPRVAAIVLLDAFSYATLPAYSREFFQRCARVGVLRASAGAVAVGARLGARLLRRGDSSPPAGRVSPPKAEARKLLGELLDRGTKILFIYSATLHVRCNHKEQLFEAFPELRGRVDVEYFADADHLFTELSTRRRLMDAVTAWLSRTFT